MSGYTKNIAVIRGLKSGFSVDGGPLSGLVKAEKYGVNLRVDVSLINFAPLTEGKYVCAVSDGIRVCVLDGLTFDGESLVDTGAGFAALICFVNGEVSPVASAVCGDFHYALSGIRIEIERQENLKRDGAPEAIKYEDEALAQENYYEFGQADKSGGAVCEDPQKEEKRQGFSKNEEAVSFEKGGLSSGGNFYSRMKDEIEKVLTSYPKEEALETMVEQSRWVRITYGDGKFYVFGVIYGGGEAQYICYGVPSENPVSPPPSIENSSFIPAYPEGNSGYWVMYQDAKTGASIKITLR
ncbi:MAG: hypothetical protein K2N23_07835 [Clostridia bacterium]|nr:hypothetical protein [Clostridia bacterium]